MEKIMKELAEIKTAIKELEQQKVVFLNQKQIHLEFEIHRGTLNRRVKEGLLAAYRISGKVFYKRSEIIAMIEKGKEPLKARA